MILFKTKLGTCFIDELQTRKIKVRAALKMYLKSIKSIDIEVDPAEIELREDLVNSIYDTIEDQTIELKKGETRVFLNAFEAFADSISGTVSDLKLRRKECAVESLGTYLNKKLA